MSREAPRVVVDTSVLISAILLPNSVPAQAARLAREIGAVLVSHETLTELATVLSRSSFARAISAEQRNAYLDAFASAAELIPVTTRIVACRDPDDDMILSLAISGSAAVIVTGDADLLTLHPFEGVDILTPRQFLDAFPTEQPAPGGAL